MSTRKEMREFERSWSDENLFQIQSRERIERLEEALTASKADAEGLVGVVAEKTAEIEELTTTVQRLRVRVYDLQRSEEQLRKRVQKRAKKPKKPRRKSSHFHDEASAKAAAERKAWEEAEARALALVEKELKKQRAKEQEEEEDPTYDYGRIAEQYPNIALSTVLEAERDFVKADTDGSGLIEKDELEALLRKSNPGITAEELAQVVADMHLDGTHHGITFLDALKVVNELGSEAPRLSQAIIESSRDSRVCIVQ